MEPSPPTAAPANSAPSSAPAAPAFAPTSNSAKPSPPGAPVLSKLRAIPINQLTLALLLLAALAGWLALPPASQLQALLNLAVASVVCVGADALIFWQSKKIWKLSVTSLISALILASILAPETPALLLAILALLSVILKRLLHDGPFPIFNPAAFALVIGGLAFGTLDAWWAFTPSLPSIIILLLAILLLSWRQNRWLMEISFLLGWLAGWALFSHFPSIPPSMAGIRMLLNLLPLYLMAFMLLEPKTSPIRPRQQLVYGAIAALAAVFLLPRSPAVDMVLVGLMLGNLAKKIMEKFKIGA